jgi:predicted phage-related endonuclease
VTSPATGIEQLVCEDIASRQRLGIAKYGVTVGDSDLTLRQWLQHAYEECLDQAVYLRRAIDELEKANKCIDN